MNPTVWENPCPHTHTGIRPANFFLLLTLTCSARPTPLPLFKEPDGASFHGNGSIPRGAVERNDGLGPRARPHPSRGARRHAAGCAVIRVEERVPSLNAITLVVRWQARDWHGAAARLALKTQRPWFRARENESNARGGVGRCAVVWGGREEGNQRAPRSGRHPITPVRGRATLFAGGAKRVGVGVGDARVLREPVHVAVGVVVVTRVVTLCRPRTIRPRPCLPGKEAWGPAQAVTDHGRPCQAQVGRLGWGRVVVHAHDGGWITAR